MDRKPPASVEAYLAGVPEPHRSALERLRKQIRAAAPKAVELISYGQAAYKLNGRMLVGFGAFKGHCSLFPWSSTAVTAHADKLRGFKTSKGTVQFTADKPLPAAVVKAIVKTRIAENDARDTRRKAKASQRRRLARRTPRGGAG